MINQGRIRKFDRYIDDFNVLVIRFMDNAENLLCGAANGSVYYVNIQTMRAIPVANFKTKM